ncbi:adenosine deaminase [Terracoccus luteus]|uniref:Adenosine deaminase n=1 Tax=Terracoccus luteus TaxID=53356 RepID=A0A495XQU4_9MICO|nr:adenosine deaminase [Terracoccus luteus]RKT76941.1 adenosine deaminase [Terracoccus luteus]
MTRPETRSRARSLADLPKAHLHLHFTGSMRVQTVRELAAHHGIRLPDALTTGYPPRLARATDERGWFRFQRLYDAARACVRTEADLRRIVREAAEDDAAEGSRWLELQVDPTSYAPFVGGLTPALEIVLDEARSVSRTGPTGVAIVVAASRMRHPLEARTLARLAARHAGEGAGEVVGFGLSNDERRGEVAAFAPAFRIAARAGLALVPHGGELLGAQAVMETLEHLRPDRIGHGIRAVEDPQVVAAVADAGVALEVCPLSNVALGVFADPSEVPLRALTDAGVPVALGADDPLLFGSRLVDQYETVRGLGVDDAGLAALARQSVEASRAPWSVRSAALAAVDDWLAGSTKPAPAAAPG